MARTHNFDSVSEFVAESLAKAKAKKATEYCEDNRHRDYFFRTRNVAEAERLLATGWREGADRVSRLRDRLSVVVDAAATARTRGDTFDVTGLWVDVGRIATGEPECCGVPCTDFASAAERVVSLRYNAAVSGSVETSAIEARGAAVLTAVDLIESCGVRCEVIYSQGSKAYGGDALECNVVAKAADQPVDLDRLAFVLTHPSFFRRFGFAFLEGNGHAPSGSRPNPLSDRGSRAGTIEIDEVCTATGLDDEELVRNVLSIAVACGIDIGADTVSEIIECVAGGAA
jgi:hypothetical protein